MWHVDIYLVRRDETNRRARGSGEEWTGRRLQCCAYGRSTGSSGSRMVHTGPHRDRLQIVSMSQVDREVWGERGTEWQYGAQIVPQWPEGRCGQTPGCVARKYLNEKRKMSESDRMSESGHHSRRLPKLSESLLTPAFHCSRTSWMEAIGTRQCICQAL